MIWRNDYSVNRPICVYNILFIPTYTSVEKAKCLQEWLYCFSIKRERLRNVNRKKKGGRKKRTSNANSIRNMLLTRLSSRTGTFVIYCLFLFLFFLQKLKKLVQIFNAKVMFIVGQNILQVVRGDGDK